VPRAGLQPASPLIGNSVELELPGLLPKTAAWLARAAAAFSGSMNPAQGSVSVSA
jgi:hypothetical protein